CSFFLLSFFFFFFFSSRRRHTRSLRDWSSDVCSSDLRADAGEPRARAGARFAVRAVRRRGVCVGCVPDCIPPAQHVSRAFRRRRSEERRVGKECRSRWSPYHEKKKREQKKREI